MGTWGVGLYADDFASDLRSAVTAICKLPFDGQKIVQLLADLNPAARDPADESHTSFWLVVADQLHRRGIRSPAQERAVEIIAKRQNLAVLAGLGMTDADLKARERVLAQLAETLGAPMTEKARKTLKKPQPLLFAPGDVLTYPIDSRGNCYNPHLADPTLMRFTQVGWDGCVVSATGHALEFLAWYQIVPCRSFWKERPTPEEVHAQIDRRWGAAVGTLSKAHVARMRLERLGNLPPPATEAPQKERFINVVASDISASNILSRWLPAGSLG